MTDKLLLAGREAAQLLVSGYQDPRTNGVHLQTIVGTTAALAAEFALRASLATVPFGAQWISGGAADRLLFADANPGTVTVWSFPEALAKGRGLTAADRPDLAAIAANAESKLATKPFPPLSVPCLYYPHEYSLFAAPRFREGIQAIALKHGLSPVEAATALGVTLAIFLSEAKQPEHFKYTLLLAAEIMVASARMAPVTAAQAPPMPRSGA